MESKLIFSHDEYKIMLKCIESFINNIENYCSSHNDKLNYYSSDEVCNLLNISKRTLQYYRDSNKVKYVRLRSKFIYKHEDIEDLINRYHKQEKEKTPLIYNTNIENPLLHKIISLNQSYNLIKENLDIKKPRLSNGEKLFSTKEVADILKVSQRTLQEFRDSDFIRFIQLGKGKILYKESDILDLLLKNYKKH